MPDRKLSQFTDPLPAFITVVLSVQFSCAPGIISNISGLFVKPVMNNIYHRHTSCFSFDNRPCKTWT